MAGLADLGPIVRANETLAPYTYLRLGGPADWLAQPRSVEELASVVQAATAQRLPLRVLGQGCNVLVGDEGVRGVVVRLSEPAFTGVSVSGRLVHAGAGATMAALIAASTREGLAGLETLVGVKGSVGGAIRCNASNRAGEIGQLLRRVETIDAAGQRQMHDRDEFHPGYPGGLDDPVVVSAEFELDRDDPASLVRRLRKAWILRKATAPLSFQASARIFRNPRGLSAAALVEQAGLGRARQGGAEVSERDPASFIVHPGASAHDLLQLIELVRGRVQERFHVDLELEITLW